MDIKLLVNIASRAWAFPILWSLHNGTAGRQAPLLVATGAGRTAFTQSMDHLVEIGMTERNPGHGHPLRPEFRLTKKGKEVAAIANQIKTAVDDSEHEVIRRAWTLPILAELKAPRHFNELKRHLPSITDRALSQALKSMEELDWVNRTVDVSSRPPRTAYVAISTGKIVCEILQS